MNELAALSDEELESRFLAADSKWETDRRSGGWNSPQREARNDLSNELMRRRVEGGAVA